MDNKILVLRIHYCLRRDSLNGGGWVGWGLYLLYLHFCLWVIFLLSVGWIRDWILMTYIQVSSYISPAFE